MSDDPPHDGLPEARLTPYELVFGQGDFEERHFPAIRDEARERDVDLADPERFLMLGSVGALLQELVPDDADGEAFRETGILLFHAFQFWRFDRRLYVLSDEVARQLTGEPQHVGEWELTPPYPAGYLQLPRHLFWARVAEEAAAEPVDGFFWSMVGEGDPAIPPYRRVDALLALGVRPGRPGFTAVEVSAEPRGEAGHWADLDARDEGEDFSNILPGGEAKGFRALVTDAEALKLLSLCFWYVAAHPSALSAETQAAEPVREGGSSLRYQTIRPVEHG